MTKQLTADELLHMVEEETWPDPDGLHTVTDTFNRWLERGDGVAVYVNRDMESPNLGHRQFVSYGSGEAQLETSDPPEQLPDIGTAINWRYRLWATYQGDPL